MIYISLHITNNLPIYQQFLKSCVNNYDSDEYTCIVNACRLSHYSVSLLMDRNPPWRISRYTMTVLQRRINRVTSQIYVM